MSRSQFDAALQQADEAARQNQANANWSWQFRILGARAQVYRGQFKDAIARLEGPLPPELASGELAVLRYMTLASAEESAQEFDAAEIDITRSERLAAGARAEILLPVLLVRGNIEYEKGNYTGAEQAYLTVLKTSRDRHLAKYEAPTMGSLGNVSMRLEHYDEAADRYFAALQAAEAGGTTSSVSSTLGNIAWNYAALGNYESAKDFYRQAEQAAAQSSKRAERVLWLTDLANSANALQDFAPAERAAQQALSLARELQDPLTTAHSLNALADIAMNTGRLGAATEYNREAQAIAAAGLDYAELVVVELSAGEIAAASGKYTEAEQHLRKIAEDPKAGSSARWESEAQLASVYASEKRAVDAEREFRRCLKTVDQARSGVRREESRLSFLSGAMPFYGQYIDFLVDEKRFEDALGIAETGRARTLAEGLGRANRKPINAVGDAALRSLAKQLNSTLLCYWLGRQRSHLWVISQDGIAYFPLAGSAEISARVKNYREAIVSSRDMLHPANADGAKLYELLVQPAQAIIAKNPRVTILPDASLYGLNFETLLVPGAQPHYWIEDVSVTTASSLTLLAASMTRRATVAKSLLLVGDTEEVSGEFPKLAQASAEMQVVEKYFPATAREVLEGKGATPSAYLMGHPEQFGYLHFVTHGTASLTRPLESAVILSPAGETYKLYARDIVAHPLHANLVTISACNGAGTRAFSGEGLVGLSWAFLRAGAHNVIAALWEVNDRSTPQLMNALYGGLSKGQDPATALREAKLSFLRSGTVYAKPYYWAPFQLYAGS